MSFKLEIIRNCLQICGKKRKEIIENFSKIILPLKKQKTIADARDRFYS